MDNLDFIKIYFRVFIYKIIITEKIWIIQKRVLFLEYGLKMRLNAILGSKILKYGVQIGPKFKCGFGTQKGHSALLKCRLAQT